MTILVFDTENYNNDIYDIVETYVDDIKFEKLNSESIFFQRYQQDNFPLLIIDVTSTIGEVVFEKVTNENIKQKILVLSKSVNYNSQLTCEECAFKFNRKLLLKPVQANELIKYIQNYEDLNCKYSGYANCIIEILEDIMQQFVTYRYDKKTETIKKKKATTKNIEELISITEILNIHNITYSIDNEDNISLK